MKRYSILALALVLCCTMFAGCRGRNSNNGTISPTNEATAGASMPTIIEPTTHATTEPSAPATESATNDATENGTMDGAMNGGMDGATEDATGSTGDSGSRSHQPNMR